MNDERIWTIQDILSILPHRAPFLFVDRVTKLVPDRLIITERDIALSEPYFAGHFPQKAIMPGVLIVDALAQTSGLLWGLSKKSRGDDTGEIPQIFFLVQVNIKFTSPAVPPATIKMTASGEKSFGTLFSYAVEAMVERTLICKGTLTLAMAKGSL